MITSEIARTTAERISTDRLLTVTPLANGRAFVARFTTDEGLRGLGQKLILHGDESVGVVIKEDGTIPCEAEAQQLIRPDTDPMREEITVTAQLVYTCRAEDSLDVQTNHIKGDLVRLVEGRESERAECVQVAVQYVSPEAETYRTDEGQGMSERMAERLISVLGPLVCPDDANDVEALLTYGLAGLRHLADQCDLDFADADKTAYTIYRQQVGFQQ